ncbi:1935_t:CDS:2, partial [Gigaspora rosea]
MKEIPHIVTPEKALKMSKKLEKEILSSHSKIKKNIDQLENPSSYENYFNSLPNTICNFFQALITVLQQRKQKVANKKRHQPSTTDNLLIMYKTILNKLLETHINDFDMEDVHLEITNKIPIGYNILPPNVVILKPGNPPNCDENVHAACEIYRDDLDLDSNDNLYIAYNQAIFGRLISYKEANKNSYTSKDMRSTLITIFSGYGIFNLAAVLGAKYLDKFERVVDYRVTCCVLELIWIVVGIALCQYVNDKNEPMIDILN